MSPLVHLFVVVGWLFATFAGRDDGRDVVDCQGISQPVGVEGSVGEQVVSGQAFDQVWHSAQIVGLPRQQAEVDEIAKRIGQRQYLGRDAAAGAAYGLALSPPFAP